MPTKPWRKILLIILFLVFLATVSGCQVVKSIENTAHTFSKLPDHLMEALANLLGGIKDVGVALSDQVGNIIRNMTGK